MPTLVVIRHAKSDWDVPADDRHRPLAARGRRQAPESGRWIAEEVEPIELAVVSVAEGAWETWELVSAQLPYAARQVFDEAAYTFSGDDLVEVVRALPRELSVAAVVSHNPAVEELVRSLTGEWVPMPTAAVAVIDLPSWRDRGGLRWADRPADQPPSTQ